MKHLLSLILSLMFVSMQIQAQQNTDEIQAPKQRTKENLKLTVTSQDVHNNFNTIVVNPKSIDSLEVLQRHIYMMCNVLQYVDLASNGYVYIKDKKNFRRAYREYYQYLNGKRRPKAPKF